jgi:hypothetical protein
MCGACVGSLFCNSRSMSTAPSTYIHAPDERRVFRILISLRFPGRRAAAIRLSQTGYLHAVDAGCFLTNNPCRLPRSPLLRVWRAESQREHGSDDQALPHSVALLSAAIRVHQSLVRWASAAPGLQIPRPDSAGTGLEASPAEGTASTEGRRQTWLAGLTLLKFQRLT